MLPCVIYVPVPEALKVEVVRIGSPLVQFGAEVTGGQVKQLRHRLPWNLVNAIVNGVLIQNN